MKKDEVKTSSNHPRPTLRTHIWDFFRNLDVFGIVFNFKIGSESSYQTSYGGLWLFCYIILGICVFTNTIVDYFNKKQFNEQYNEIPMNFKDPADHISLDNEKFFFGMFIVNLDPDLNVQETFVINGVYRESHNNTNFITLTTPLEKIPCNPNNFSSNVNKLQSFLNSMICFNTSKLKLIGSKYDENYSNVKISIDINPKANLTKIINSIVNFSPIYQFIYNDNLIDYKDFSNFNIIPNGFYDGLDPYHTKKTDIYLSRNEYNQDLNIIFNELQTFKYTRFETADYKTTPLFLNENHLTILEIKILPNYTYKQKKKIRIKFFTVLQLTLTYMINYMLLIKIFATMINFKQAKTYLIKKIFDVDPEFISELKQNKNEILFELHQKNQDNISDLDRLSIMNEEGNINAINNHQKLGKFSGLLQRDNISFNKDSSSRNFKDDIKYYKSEKINYESKDKQSNSNGKNFNNYFKNLQLDKITNSNKTIMELSSKINLLNDKNLNIKNVNNLNNDNKKKNENENINVDQEDALKINNNIYLNTKFIKNSQKINEEKNHRFDNLLDLPIFMRKMQEIDLLKYILLEEKSIYLFDFLTGKVDFSDVQVISNQVTNKIGMELIKNSYEELRNSNHFSKIQFKLVYLYEKVLDKF